jgi:hypothetical protein
MSFDKNFCFQKISNRNVSAAETRISNHFFSTPMLFSNTMRKFLRSAIIEKINSLDCTAYDVKNALLLAQPAPHDDDEMRALNAELLQAIRNYYSAQTVENHDFTNN